MFTLTASGSVSDYSDTSNLQQNIATAAGVDKSLVTISVAAASVIITATIAVSTYATVVEVQTSLSSTLGTAADASAVLSITVESDPTITITSDDSSSDVDPPIGIGVGVFSCALLGGLSAVVGTLGHRRQQRNKPGRVKRGVTADPEAGYQMNVKDHGDLKINEA